MDDHLLELTDTVKAKPRPEVTEIPEFKELIEEVDKPQRYLAYIHHIHSPNSAYKNYADREDKVKEELFGDEDWDIPEVVQEAEEKYKDLCETPEQKLLEKAVKSVYKFMDYLEAFDPTERDENGKLVWKTKDYIRNMEKLSGVVDSLEDLRERVNKGEGSEGDIRGGVKLNQWNR